MEGINKIVTGELMSLSEQELVDCDRAYNAGCDGGLMDYAFEFIVKNGGIATESDYPYSGLNGQCDFSLVSIFKVDIKVAIRIGVANVCVCIFEIS